MRIQQRIFLSGMFCLLVLNLVAYLSLYQNYQSLKTVQTQEYIKWVDFDIPASALSRALDVDIKSHREEAMNPVNWIDLLAALAVQYGGNWKLYQTKDLDALALRCQEGAMEELKDKKYFSYYQEAYTAVLGEFVGEFQRERPSREREGGTELVTVYGLKAFSPIAEGYGYGHYEDFGNSRSYGYRRKHLGNDLLGTVGTPIAAVEGGTIEHLGWNQYGGWRIGIRSFDRKRYYYYAHLRKDHPFVQGLEEGSVVKAGDIIGYLGMTGYSSTENVNGMTKPHLHFGMQLIFDSSQEEGGQEIWIDVYHIVELLERNRVTVIQDPETKDYVRKYQIFDENFAGGVD